LGGINSGIDPIIGQVDADHNFGEQLLPKEWGNSAAEKVSCPFSGFVTMKGGEYFFSPSSQSCRNGRIESSQFTPSVLIGEAPIDWFSL
jgi:hypothetical protein